MVVCKPGTFKQHSVFECDLYVLNEEEGGRKNGFTTKYE